MAGLRICMGLGLAVGCTDRPLEDGPLAEGTATASVVEAPEDDDAPDPCGPPCAEPWEHHGDLRLFPDDEDLSAYACLRAVHGDLGLFSVSPDQLVHFRNLETVDHFFSVTELPIRDLRAFRCLREVDTLWLSNLFELEDGALPNLRKARRLHLHEVPALPSFAPDYAGIGDLDLGPGVASLDGAATWPGLDSVEVRISDNDELTSVAGVAGVVAGAPAWVSIYGLPELESLHGLETITETDHLFLADLPRVTDLSQLSGIRRAGELGIDGMPGLTSYAGLHNLERADTIVLGECWWPAEHEAKVPDLRGFDALVEVHTLMVFVDGVTSLAGAPNLRRVDELYFDDDLPLSAVDNLLAQLTTLPVVVEAWPCKDL